MKIPVNKAKMIATFGPAISSPKDFLEIVKSGVDVIRFNFSHGSYEDHYNGFELVKQINREYNLNIAILADMQGPKIRIGNVNGSIELQSGKEIQITDIKQDSSNQLLYISYDELYKEMHPGERILINDGRIELVVKSVENKLITAKIVHGGLLTSKKGVNLPDTALSTPALTPKDKLDVEFALQNEANWIALSFVRSAKDIEEIASIIGEKRSYTKIIAKIEKPEAIQCIEEIITATDGIMIARGDLGVEIPQEHVPLVQKRIIKKCILAAKPVIVATQMMESMIENPVATRAEINDVANAVIDGADAVMLSGETSVGKYPTKVLQTMQRILTNVEKSDLIYDKQLVANPKSETYISDAICYNACKIAKEVGAKAIVGMTRSGYTAFMISSYRPKAQIFIFTDNEKLLPTLNLFWGVRAFYYKGFVGTDETITDVIKILQEHKHLKVGDLVVNTASMPLNHQGRTNTVKVSRVKALEN
ncbi:MAG: pyruvate kinase [Chitinophagales bacterium]|nr:pyruvate kinase [Chitinophagales bacterium]